MVIFLCKKYKVCCKIVFCVKVLILNCSKSNFYLFILSSSVVERSTVNRLVVGSSPTWGVNNHIVYQKFLYYRI